MEQESKQRLKVKVCGMRERQNIADLIKLEPDYIGFIFYRPSGRYFGEPGEGDLEDIPSSAKKTGVFVNAEAEEIRSAVRLLKLGAVQLHGNESADLCKELSATGLEVIKAFGIDETFRFDTLKAYEDAVDYFLFDTKTSKHGGSGKAFDWKLLERNDSTKGYFLSGGIGPEEAGMVKSLKDPRLYAVDLNSRFEAAPGLKDIHQLQLFIEQLKSTATAAERKNI
ncbi:phosphoribosylanthranilate isomerase [Arcticibacter sp. MXS-1]|uniref:phosphoribosylanthranilate isomerase n=1 Tax=Arcticibacter sp. MXS-1 TaxID=3341726 RepID=UPI0035A92953